MSGVPLVRLGDCSEIVSGATPKTGVADYWDGEIAWATPKDLSNLGSKYLATTPQTLTEAGYRSCSAKIMPAGSVLFSSRAPIGHVAINKVPMCTNQGFKSFVPDPERVSADYLYYWLKANKAYLQSLGNGATFKEVSKATIEEVRIPLPDLAEQRRIAEILDKADALRAKRREAIAKLDQLLQSTFLAMFSCTNEEGATVADLAASDAAIRTGPFGSQLLHSEFVDEGVAVLGIDNAVGNSFAWGKPRFITEEKYASLARYRVFPGDVLITIMGTCGRCAVVPDDIPVAINTKHLCCITLNRNRCEPEYLHSYFLMHPKARSYLESRAKGAIMSGLNMGVIKELPVALPSIDKQKRYVSMKVSLLRQRKRMVDHLDRSAGLLASLQHRAFAGTL